MVTVQLSSFLPKFPPSSCLFLLFSCVLSLYSFLFPLSLFVMHMVCQAPNYIGFHFPENHRTHTGEENQLSSCKQYIRVSVLMEEVDVGGRGRLIFLGEKKTKIIEHVSQKGPRWKSSMEVLSFSHSWNAARLAPNCLHSWKFIWGSRQQYA